MKALGEFLAGARPEPAYPEFPRVPMVYERWIGPERFEVPTVGFVYAGPATGRRYEVLQQYDARVGRYWTWRDAGGGEAGAPTSTLDDLHPTPEACLAHLDAADRSVPPLARPTR